jgi:hypothetical protein
LKLFGLKIESLFKETTKYLGELRQMENPQNLRNNTNEDLDFEYHRLNKKF